MMVDVKFDALYRYISLHREPPEVGLVEKITVLVGGAVRANPT